MLSIEKILKKRKWTGEDLGRLEVASAFDIFRQIKAKETLKPIIRKEVIENKLDELEEYSELQKYTDYLSLHEWIKKTFSEVNTAEQRANLNFNILFNIIENAEVGEQVYFYMQDEPQIMTEHQYTNFCNEKAINTFNLIGKGIKFYIKKLQEEPNEENPIKPLIDKLKSEPIENKAIIKKLNEFHMYNYYIEEMEKQKRIRVIDFLEESTDLTEYDKGKLLAFIPHDINTAKYKYFYDGVFKDIDIEADFFEFKAMTEYDLYYCNKFYTWVDHEAVQNKFKEWEEIKNNQINYDYILTHTQKIFKKWHLLEHFALYEHFPAFKSKGTLKEQIRDINAFIKEFPELFKVMLEDLEGFFQGVSCKPIKELLNKEYSLNQLYNLKIYNYINIFNSNKVAVLKNNQAGEVYNKKDINNRIDRILLEQYFDNRIDLENNLSIINESRDALFKSYYYIKGYNTAIDLIVNHFKIKEIESAKKNTNFIDVRISLYNYTLYYLYAKIKRYHKEEPLKYKKLDVLKNILKPIDIDSVIISKTSIAKAKRDIKDFKAFKDINLDLMDTLGYKK